MLNENKHANKDDHRSIVSFYSEYIFESRNMSFDSDMSSKWGTVIMALTIAESMGAGPDV